jgi:hypothetical protein
VVSGLIMSLLARLPRIRFLVLFCAGRKQMFGKKVSGQTTQKLFMTPAVSSAVAPSARNFQEEQQVTMYFSHDLLTWDGCIVLFCCTCPGSMPRF